MDEQLCMFFSPSGELIRLVDPADTLKTKNLIELRDSFDNALPKEDREHFLDLFRDDSDDIEGPDGSCVFSLTGFYGYTLAFAEKEGEENDGAIAVYLFRNAKRLNEYLSPSFVNMFPTLAAVGEANENGLSPEAALLFRNAPCLMEQGEDYTDISLLTELFLKDIGEDPVFFGNSFRMDLPCSEEKSVSGDELLRFSHTAYLYTLYAVFTALIEATASHEIIASVQKNENGAEISFATQTDQQKTEQAEASDGFGLFAVFAEYSEALLEFAEGLARSNSFDPRVRYSPDDGTLSVMLTVSSSDTGEGEFRYRDPYGTVSAIVREAAWFYRFLGVRDAALFDEEEQG